MITGATDTWFTLEEFAAMIGRSEKTVRNWIAEGRIEATTLCGVPLIAMSTIENLISGTAISTTTAGDLALKLSNRMTPSGQRATPERHAPRKRLDHQRRTRLSVNDAAEGAT